MLASPGLAVAAALATAYPAVLEPAALNAWLRQSTDLAPDQIIAVSPSVATAIVAQTAAGGGRTQLLLRAEALTPQAVARTGLIAWEMRLDVDCRGGMVRTGETSGYVSRVPDGEPVAVAPAKSDWAPPPAGTALESAWRATCDASFRPPLAANLRIARILPTPIPAVAAPRASSPVTAHPVQISLTTPLPQPRAATGVARNTVAEAPAPASPVAHGGKRAAQVVSSPVQADTQRSLASLKSRFGEQLAGLETRVEPAQVGGRTVYRGVVAGFATHGDAESFCATLRSRGQACLAR